MVALIVAERAILLTHIDLVALIVAKRELIIKPISMWPFICGDYSNIVGVTDIFQYRKKDAIKKRRGKNIITNSCPTILY